MSIDQAARAKAKVSIVLDVLQKEGLVQYGGGGLQKGAEIAEKIMKIVDYEIDVANGLKPWLKPA